MNEIKIKPLKAVVVLHEGVPGHRNQSLGIAEELQKECGAVVKEFEVPNFSGLERFLKVKSKLKNMSSLSVKEIGQWLDKAEGRALADTIESWLKEFNIKAEEVLLISAGSRAAPYTFCISKLLGSAGATLMIPKYLGTAPFDFGIIPTHDAMEDRANELVTLGAPNRIKKEVLEKAKAIMLAKYPPHRDKCWTILIGGESGTFRIPPGWVKKNLDPIFAKAEAEGADIYLSTSRRTRKDTEQEIRKLYGKHPAMRVLWLASEQAGSPVPGFLGLSDRAYCTEDSISMVSETLTAGRGVILLRTEYVGGLKGFKQVFKKIGRKVGFLNSRSAWKPEKFKILYDQFREKGWLFDPGKEPKIMPEIEFHEARRAAKWILEQWKLR